MMSPERTSIKRDFVSIQRLLFMLSPGLLFLAALVCKGMVFSLTATPTFSQDHILAVYNFVGLSGDEPFLAPSGTAPLITAGNIIRGPEYGETLITSFTANALAFSPGYKNGNFHFLSNYNLETAVSEDAYFELTLTVAEGYYLNVYSVLLGTRRASQNTGPNYMAIRSSLDNFMSDLVTGVPAPGGGGNLPETRLLEFRSALENITGSVTLRFYGYQRNAANSSYGIWAISNPPDGLFTVNGTVSTTPVSPKLAGGEAFPAGGEGRYGIIGVAEGQSSGAVDVFGNGPYDLFSGLRTLYPFVRFDQNNVPVYGAPQTVTSPNASGHVFETEGGDIFALVFSGNTLYLRQFNRNSLAFSEFSSRTMPVSGGGNVTGFIDESGKVHVYYTLDDGTEYYPSPGSHDKEYRPFDGSGFWRGGFNYTQPYYARFTDSSLLIMEINRRIGSAADGYDYLFGCPGQTIGKYGDGPLGNVLIGANKLGVFRCFYPGTNGPDSLSFAVDDSAEPVILRHPIVNPNPTAIRNPVSGFSDLIVSDSARYWHYPFKGIKNDNTPIYGNRSPLLRSAGKIICGALPVISPGDINGNGLVDFIFGNDAGELLMLRNIGRPGAPEFPLPVEILAGGRPYRERAGYEGSVQGPGEAVWGYTCPTLFDWNGNGKLDIVMNTIRGNLIVLLQEDGAADPPRFSEPLPLFCDSLDLHLSWRTQPGVTTWGETTVPCIIANDENNELRMFFRQDNQNVIRGSVLRLENGSAVRAHDSRYGGQFGRSKIVPVDWDGDGRIDLLIGTGRSMSIPGPGGIPDNLTGDERQATVLFLRNAGSNEQPVFQWPIRLAYKGEAIKQGIHSCSPAPVDFGNGLIGLVLGRERGELMFYEREELWP